MAKSRNSCFKIIACGSDSAESDDFERTESTTSTDKRGWSFRKRSPRHRVLSNTVISEISSAGLKDNQGATTSDSYAKTNSTVPAKSSASEAKDETVPSFPSAAVNMKIADTLPAHGNGNDSVCTVQESVAILIQSAIRGYLAKKALSKLKSVVKLQAAVRGHLVRRQAVGTLRCVHAIVKMQALVRARLSLERLNVQEKSGGEPKTEGQRVNSLENSVAEVNKTYTSTKMLLANGFARQLLESKPKTRPIYINCDPSRSDSAWKWLERWMSVTSSDNGQPEKHLNPDYQENGAETNPTAYEIGTEGHSGILSVPTDLVSGVKEAEIVVEGEDNLNIDNADEFEFQACKPTASGKTSSSAVEDDMEDGFFGIPQETSTKTMKACKPTASGKTSSSAVEDDMEDGFFGIPQETSTNTMKAIEETPGSFSNQVETQSSATEQELLGTDSDKPEINTENLTRAAKRVASEQIGSEGKKFIFGSRKSINPAFAAVQSKFEELSSAATSGRSISSSYPDATPESRLDSPSSWTGSVTKAKDVSMTEDSISHDPRIQMWGSECGTELSISSTLDSPDRHEAEGGEFVNETRSSDKGGSDKFNLGNLDAYKDSVSHSGYVQPGKLQEVVENSSDSVSPLFPTKGETNPSEQVASDIHGQLDTRTDQPVESLSPEGSPRSPITAPDSHGTPSSQISLNSKKKKSDNLPSQKRRPQSSGKKTMPNQIHDSAVRNSSEHLPRDLRNGTKRNSFDHEPRNSSSNPLPSYMQATESAKAKAHVSHSPKSSPDVQEKDSYVKKRHSLPVTTGKQDSPRMQRSMSQAQQTTKGGATHSPQTATERRWQR